MSIFLIRHGETAANAARVVQVPETPLSEKGDLQAGRLARRLAGAGVGRILSSDLPRAARTAEHLTQTTRAPVEFDSRLQERNFGDLRGTAYAKLEVDLFAPGYAPPGGESWEAFHIRVDRAWERIVEVAAACSASGHLAVVTHGLVCASLVTRHFYRGDTGEIASGGHLHFGNTSLTVVEGVAPWTVEQLNCTAHLDEEFSDDANAISGL